MTSRILAVDDSPLILKLIVGILSPVGYEIQTASSGAEALARVEEIKPDLIILDVAMPGMDGYELCRKLRQMPVAANRPIMMLTALDLLENKIKGFEAGADDYMPKPFQAAELRARIEALLLRSSAPAELGLSPTAKIIAVFSLRGGSGVSSVAANLVTGLAQLWEVPAVLVDLALITGQAALMLNLPLRHTWADLASLPPEEIDLELLESVLLQHVSGVRVLAAPSRPEQSELISAGKVTYTLAQIGQRYPYVVLDLPHDFGDPCLAGLDAATEIVALMTPDLASVRAMASTLDVFDMLEYPAEKVRLVLNNTFQRHGLSRRDIEGTLHRSIALEIPFAPDAFVPAINLGLPPILNSPASEAAVTLEDFAFQLSKEEHVDQPPEAPSAAWRRVNRRLRRR